MAFEWDEAKDAENLRKHGIRFEEAREIFNGPTLTWFDDRYEYGEIRETSLGMLGASVVLYVVHTDREGVTRIVSARKATKKERQRYYGHLKNTLG